MRDMLASALLSSEKPDRVGSIETIFWLIDCSLVTPRQMELPELTTLLFSHSSTLRSSALGDSDTVSDWEILTLGDSPSGRF